MTTVKVPFTNTLTNHGLVIQSGGQAIGAITNWSPDQGRGVTPVFEFGQITTGAGDDIQADPGEPYEIVPGNITNTTLRINRYDIYTLRFEQVFGTTNLEMLTKQSSAIKFQEYWSTPNAGFNFTYSYYGAWFNSLGRQHDSNGNRIVMANATAMYTRRREYSFQ